MKTKKIVTAVAAMTMCAVSVFAFTACDECKEHNYIWAITTPATCTVEGVETGVCQNCGSVSTRPVPAGHNFSEWQLEIAPTEYNEGKAVRVCPVDSCKEEVSLPAVTLENWDEYSSLEKQENSLTEFTYPSEYGDITANTVVSVKDAVAIALSNQSKIVSGEVWNHTDLYAPDSAEKHKIADAKALFEFGDKYYHYTSDIEDVEYFYTLNEDGTIFSPYTRMREVNEGSQTVVYKEIMNNREATLEEMSGYGYTFTWLYGLPRKYGVETFINFMYQDFINNINDDAVEKIELQEDGTFVYSFSYSTKDNYNGIDLASVSFTLDKDFTLKTAVIEDYTYDPEQYVIEDDGHFAPIDKDVYHFYERFNVTQDTEREGPAPENPYNLEQFLIQSFDMYSQDVEQNSEGAIIESSLLKEGELVSDGALIEVDADEQIVFALKNISPSTYNLNFDQITATLIDSEGNEKECVIDPLHLTDGEILSFATSYTTLSEGKPVFIPTINFRSLLAGEFKIVIKSAYLTKTINLKVNAIAPSDFSANVYQYNAYKDEWKTDNYTKEYTVYEGQSLNFNSYVPHPYYEEAGFTCTVQGDGNYTLTDDVLNGVDVQKFVAKEAGVYRITLVNDFSDTITSELTVNVVPAPAMTDVLSGALFNVNSKIYLSFNDDQTVNEGDITGTATVITNWDGSENPDITSDKWTSTVISYSYDAEEGLSAEYLSGANEKFKYNLELDDAFNMFFIRINPTSGKTQRIYLYAEIPNQIVGTYKMTSTPDDAVRLEANIAGNYEITADRYTNVFYGIYSGTTDREIKVEGISGATEITLNVGEVLRVWCLGANTSGGAGATEYTVTYIGADETQPEA